MPASLMASRMHDGSPLGRLLEEMHKTQKVMMVAQADTMTHDDVGCMRCATLTVCGYHLPTATYN